MSEHELAAFLKKQARQSHVYQWISSILVVLFGIGAFYFTTKFTLSDHEKRITNSEGDIKLNCQSMTIKHDADIKRIDDKIDATNTKLFNHINKQ